MTWMIIRLVLSLAFVAGVLWFAARLAKKRGLGGGAGLIEVVARQRMGRNSTVSVLRVADRVLVVGATEEQVTLLAEMDAEVVEDALAEADAERQARALAHRESRQAALAARTAARDPDGEAALPAARRTRHAPAAGRHGGVSGGTGLLAGSVFDRAAWTSVVEGLRDRTVRRP